MGGPKAGLTWGRTTLLGRATAALRVCTSPVWVVTRNASSPLPPLPDEVVVVHDAAPDGGPLAAVVAALRAARGTAGCEGVFVCACDMPFVDEAVVRWLAAHWRSAETLPRSTETLPRSAETLPRSAETLPSVLMPRHAGALQPLAAIYSVRDLVLSRAAALLAAGDGTLRDLVALPNARILDDADIAMAPGGGAFLTNVNTPEDLAKARADLD